MGHTLVGYVAAVVVVVVVAVAVALGAAVARQPVQEGLVCSGRGAALIALFY